MSGDDYNGEGRRLQAKAQESQLYFCRNVASRKRKKKRVLCVATLWFTQERTGTSGILSRSHDHLNLGFLFVLQMWMSAFVLNILLIDFDFVSFDILIMMVRTRWLLARVKLYCVGHQLLVALWPRLSSTFN